MNELEQKILAAIARNPGKSNAAIAKNYRGATNSLVAALRGGAGPTPVTVTQSAPEGSQGPGIALRGMRVLSRRPADSAAKFIKRIPRGRGFDPKDLSREWGMSEETIRRHARDLNCLKYVEVAEDEWVALVMSPETAKSYTL